MRMRGTVALMSSAAFWGVDPFQASARSQKDLTAAHARAQSAIASTPSAAWQGYLLGGIMWFCIPFTLSTSLGLATVALDLPLSTSEANMGLVPIAAASVRASCLSISTRSLQGSSL